MSTKPTIVKATITKAGRTPRVLPYPMHDIERDSGGVLRYTKLPPSLVEMLRTTVGERPDHEALVELGGERLSYQEVWDRSARVAGGLRAAGVERGDRVAIRLLNSNDWALAFYGIQMTGAVAVPVNTRFTDSEVEYVVSDSGAGVVIAPGDPLPDGEPFVVDDLVPDRPGGDLLHERHHRLPQGRHDHAGELPLQLRDVPAGDRLRGRRRHPQPDLRAHVPRHGLQQPAAHHPHAGRHRR